MEHGASSLPVFQRPQDERMSRLDTQPDFGGLALCLPRGGQTGAAAERVHHHDGTGRRGQCIPSVQRFLALIDNEVMSSRLVPPTNKHHIRAGQRLGYDAGKPERRRQFAHQQASLAQPGNPYRPLGVRHEGEGIKQQFHLLAAVRQVSQSGHVPRQMPLEDHRRAAVSQFQQLSQRIDGHVRRGRHRHDTVARAFGRNPAAFGPHSLQETVRHVVEPESVRPQRAGRCSNRLLQQPVSFVDVHFTENSTALMPVVEDRPIQQHVVVGLSALEDALAAGDISVQRRHIMPDGIAGIHLRRGIEQPARPGRVVGRICAADAEYMVDSGNEHPVHQALHFLQRLAEMLGQPRAGFGRR